MKLNRFVVTLAVSSLLFQCSQQDHPFQITRNSVREGNYRARVLSSTQMTSNYPMEHETGIEQPILFKLSINGADNEGGMGQDHYLVIPEGITEFYAPTLRFGEHLPPSKNTTPPIDRSLNAHFRVDLKPILQAFAQTGQYVTPTADTIRREDFIGLYLAGNTAPLSWIWDSSALPPKLKFRDMDQDSIFELTIHFEPFSDETTVRTWELHEDLSGFPKFSSPNAPLLEAITNMALEEALLNVRSDGAFSAGKEWSGVWTRDVSYATQLSLAYLFPEEAKASLRHKLSPDGRIVQDTGTGGAWPISSDRFTWVLAAWEIFLATGDQAWLDEIRDPVMRALQEDILWNRDPVSGLLLGETSFEDWREQTYPPWMSPADIHASHAQSTNIIFKRALEIGLALAQNDREVSASWPGLIQRLDANIIAHFWDQTLEAPSSYQISSPAWQGASHRDLLGESLGILFSQSYAEVDSQLVASYPRTAYGSPVISHQLPHSPPYHNQAIWPFVEAYALLSAKSAHNQTAYAHSFKGLTRAAALFLSHRENYQYITGAPDETEINSDRQLWSVAGWLSAIYKGLFGIEVAYDFDGRSFELNLHPNNPFDWDDFALEGLTLHGTPLNIKLKGSGQQIQSLQVNGEQLPPGTPLKLDGKALRIVIELQAEVDPGSVRIANLKLPDIPATFWSVDTLNWSNETGSVILERNGRILDTISTTPILIPDSLTGFFTLRSLDEQGFTSLPSQPQYLGASATLVLTSEAPYYVELGKENAFLKLGFSLPVDGNYLIRFIYSNGSGPINTGNTCGLAKLSINDWWLEQMISFPHTGSWDTWLATSWGKANFKAGQNSIVLDQESLPVTNMNGSVNLFRVTKVEIVPIN